MNVRTPTTGGLQIPQGLGAGKSKLDMLMEKFSTIPAIEQELTRLGIHDMPQPQVALPAVTAEVLMTPDSRAYTTLYAEQLGWFNYLAPILSRIEVNLLQAENIFTLIEAEIKDAIYEQNKMLEKKEKMSESEVKNKVLIHPYYQDCLLEVQRYKQFKDRIDTQAKIASRNMTVISRQVEIRRQEIEGGQRENNMPRHGQFRPLTPR